MPRGPGRSVDEGLVSIFLASDSLDLHDSAEISRRRVSATCLWLQGFPPSVGREPSLRRVECLPCLGRREPVLAREAILEATMMP
jgi:hypothetical protein